MIIDQEKKEKHTDTMFFMYAQPALGSVEHGF